MNEIKRYDVITANIDGQTYSKLRERSDGSLVAYADHQAAIEAAVLAEREACALLVLTADVADSDFAPGVVDTLVDAIRARTPQPIKEDGK